MKKKTYIMIVLTFIFCSGFSQEIDRNYIDDWVINTFPSAELDSTVLYVLNGYPFDFNSINAELSKYKKNDLTVIYFWDKNILNGNIYGCPRHHVILIQVGQQKRKDIEKDLITAKEKFHPNSNKNKEMKLDQKEPALIINNILINEGDSFNKLSNLRISEIKGINIISIPVNQKIYGLNGTNGLIIITMK